MSAFSDDEPTQIQTASESPKNYRKSTTTETNKARKPFDFREVKKEINKTAHLQNSPSADLHQSSRQQQNSRSSSSVDVSRKRAQLSTTAGNILNLKPKLSVSSNKPLHSSHGRNNEFFFHHSNFI